MNIDGNARTCDQLRTIAQAATERLGRIYELYELGSVPSITPGMVDAILEAARQQETPPQPALPAQAAADTPPAPQPKAVKHPSGKRYGMEPDEFRARVLSDVQRIAGPNGTWVRIADFDTQRDERLPTAPAVARRLRTTWADVVHMALGDRTAQPDRAERLQAGKRRETPPQEATFRRPSAQAAAVLGPEHVVINPLRNGA